MKNVRVLWLIVGFILAPATPSLLQFFLSTAKGDFDSLGNLATFLLMSYAVTAPLTVLVGVPVLAWAERRNLARWWVAAPIGATCGAAFTWAFYSQDPPLSAVSHFAVSGASIATVVWAFSQLGKLHERRLAANNSFKPNPLRGSA